MLIVRKCHIWRLHVCVLSSVGCVHRWWSFFYTFFFTAFSVPRSAMLFPSVYFEDDNIPIPLTLFVLQYFLLWFREDFSLPAPWFVVFGTCLLCWFGSSLFFPRTSVRLVPLRVIENQVRRDKRREWSVRPAGGPHQPLPGRLLHAKKLLMVSYWPYAWSERTVKSLGPCIGEIIDIWLIGGSYIAKYMSMSSRYFDIGRISAVAKNIGCYAQRQANVASKTHRSSRYWIHFVPTKNKRPRPAVITCTVERSPWKITNGSRL